MANVDAVAEQLVDVIAELEAGITGDSVSVKTKVIHEGKFLRKLQKVQKKQQDAAKATGEQPQTWKEYLIEVRDKKLAAGQPFPEYYACTRYMRISQYPGAYEAGMSIREAYKMATAWKKNGGSPPLTSKLAIKVRLPNQIMFHVGKAKNKLEDYNSSKVDWSEKAETEKWDEDDFAGMERVLESIRKEASIALSKLKAIAGVRHA